jgi:hypothetical protein
VTLLHRIPHLGPLLRTWQGRVILVIALSQLLLPLHYYLANRDPHDERFAWRMFSPMRMTTCATELRVAERRVDLGTEFHEAWIELAQRGRFVVVEAMAARLCAKHPGQPVTLRMECRYLGRPEPQTYGGFDLCQVPQI